jgi:PKD repeat protein
LVVTDINGCSSAPSIPVTVTYHPTPATPVINASGPLEFCAGNSVTLSIGGGVSYLWSNGALTSAVTTAQSGTFFAQLTDAFGCVSLNSAPVDVLVNPLPAAPILSSSEGLSFCQNGSSILTASQPIGIEWNTTETTSSIIVDAAGVYSATYTDANNCESATASIALSIIPLTPPPTIIASGLTTLCQGDSVVLTSSSADSYQWTTASAAGTIIGTSNSIIANATDTYTVETSGLCPSPNMTASINVTVRPLPEPIIAYDTTIIDCLPSVIPFTATATGLGPLAYGWNFGDGNGAQTLNANHEYQAPGLYTVSIVAIDQFGCTGYQTIPGMVKILPRADLKYSITPQSVSLSNAEVTFNGLSQNSTNDNWQIMLIEDGLDTTDIAAFDTSYATHTFADTGVYTITYTVTTAEGCVATAKDYVNVYEDFEIFIPMGFSPDGDGINDEFFPVLPGFEIDDYEFRIFNRWGRQVFLTYSTSTGWSGDDMPIGYYFWKIKGKSRISQEPVDLDGYLFLLRN